MYIIKLLFLVIICIPAHGKSLVSLRVANYLIDDIYQSINKCLKSDCSALLSSRIASDSMVSARCFMQNVINDLKLSKKDIFCDVGSGTGKLAMHVYLTTPVKASIGIESSPTRWNQAQQARNDLKKLGLKHKRRKLKFYESDVDNMSFKSATVVSLLSPTFFEEHNVRKINNKLKELRPDTRILTVKKLENPDNLTFIKEYKVSDKTIATPVYLYTVKNIVS
jgi:ubiquinone/menaquinone biosynthesis C-methylase UbiE